MPITMIGNGDACVDSYTGAIVLTDCNVTLKGNDGYAIGTNDKRFNKTVGGSSTVSATDSIITVTGSGNQIANAYWGGIVTLDTCTVTGSGTNNVGLYADSDKTITPFASTINVINSTLTSAGSGSSAAFISNGSVLNVVGSTIHGDSNGIVISDGSNTLGPNTVALSSRSTLTNLAGAAFKVEGAVVNIAVTNSTVDSGVGATQHTLLDVIQAQQAAASAPLPPVPDPTAVAPTPQVGTFPSVVNLTAANNSILNGDILVPVL